MEFKEISILTPSPQQKGLEFPGGGGGILETTTTTTTKKQRNIGSLIGISKGEGVSLEKTAFLWGGVDNF